RKVGSCTICSLFQLLIRIYNSIIDTASFRQSIIASRAGTVSAKVLASGADPRVVAILAPDCTRVFIACNVAGNGMDIGSVTGTYGKYVNSNNTVGGGFDGIADLQYAQLSNPYRFKGNQYNARLDFLPTSNDRITFTSNFTQQRATTADTAAQSRPQSDINSKRLNYAFAGIYAHTFSSSWINEFRVNLTKFGYNELDTNPDANFGLPRIEIEGIFGDRLRYGINRSEATPGIFNEKQLHFKDTLTFLFGNHNVKFGGEYRRDLNGNSAAGGARPIYSFLRPWNFANGTPIFEGINTDANGNPLANDTKLKYGGISAFVQDDWKFRPNLTLNLGLRWEYFSPATPGSGEVLGNLILGSNGLSNATIETAKTLTNRDLNNFAPQLGFAWSPKRFNDKLVIRGGGGLGYDRLGLALIQNARFNPPNASRFGICCGISGEPGDDWSTPFVGGQIQYVASSDGTIYGYPRNPNLGGGGYGANGGPKSGSVEIYGVPRDLPTAHVYRYSLEGEYQLPSKFVATLGYQGSIGRHFVRILPLHALSTTSSTFNPVYYGSPDVNTSYNALNATIKRRFSNGFDLNVNYRFSKSLDTTSLEAPCGCTNQTYPYDNSQEKGPSDFDVTHFLVASGTFEPKWFKGQNNIGGDLLAGWNFSPIVTWRGGFPWTPVNGQSIRGQNGTFFGPLRPSLYFGTQPVDNSNANFLNGGIFSGTVNGNNCDVAPGCNTAFATYTIKDNTNTPTFQLNPPGIGRNVFRGPRYFSVDLAIAKNFSLAKIGGLFNEDSKVDIRFNFFNLFNNLNLAPFGANSDSTNIRNTRFGVATSALAGRVGELQVRFSF
ncbi:MAG TPA: TonB-dependent receptor, partial [Pyrinomonadaceae bacterium]|nr:TonB-dependent receptor [Pyrinomonadaceae bacterium]